MSIYINAYDGICSLGSNKNEIMQNIFKCKPSVTKNQIQSKDFMVGKIENLQDFSKDVKEVYKTRTNLILHHLLLNMQEPLNELLTKFSKERIAVIIGTTTAGVEENYKSMQKIEPQLFFTRNSLSNASEFVKDYLGLKSLAFSVSCACTSGAKVFIEAARLLESNLCDAVICGGVDSLNTLTIYGFDSLEILSQNNALPFSNNRDGINISEGAALFILSKDIADIKLKGFAANNDAFHITKPNENFTAQKDAIISALNMANLNTSDIDYINLHGTGTNANDKMEANLINDIFPNTSCSSTKGLMGHTLGAAGALEALICANIINQSLQNSQSQLPPHYYDGIYDKELPKINLTRLNTNSKIKNCLSISFAFGGDNSAIILGV
ncbi:beta-ketoacyl synthase N-terminal-like domain-containing protein [Campylobacter devanensis]|uniref:beta-ketoacyl synthase N-terminal-like domain-containing protein n=1 Tax=Campylobacter devanensis TaxID=3161138 RepID=UPI001EEF974F|nr:MULTISPECIES: beta-ketoacyl synthase N-terminal-like domain-containing protein [unclassified Campylobacter]MEE3711443.1 beta-ketoacyl synthase N-terminal-like domain-containing protein [Campylobacter sp. CLAX-7218-21]